MIIRLNGNRLLFIGLFILQRVYFMGEYPHIMIVYEAKFAITIDEKFPYLQLDKIYFLKNMSWNQKHSI